MMRRVVVVAAAVASLWPGWSSALAPSDSVRERLTATPAIDRSVVDAFATQDPVKVFVFLKGAPDGRGVDGMVRGIPTAELTVRHRYQRIPAFTAHVTARGYRSSRSAGRDSGRTMLL
jgi:hypothetical protein